MGDSPKTRGRTRTELRSGFTHNLLCKLDADEMAERRHELLERLDEIDRLEEELRLHNKRAKNIIAGVRSDVLHLRTVLGSGEERRPVECREVARWEQGIIVTFRNDLDQIVPELGHRAITPDDRQTDLIGDEEEDDG